MATLLTSELLEWMFVEIAPSVLCKELRLSKFIFYLFICTDKFSLSAEGMLVINPAEELPGRTRFRRMFVRSTRQEPGDRTACDIESMLTFHQEDDVWPCGNHWERLKRGTVQILPL